MFSAAKPQPPRTGAPAGRRSLLANALKQVGAGSEQDIKMGEGSSSSIGPTRGKDERRKRVYDRMKIPEKDREGRGIQLRGIAAQKSQDSPGGAASGLSIGRRPPLGTPRTPPVRKTGLGKVPPRQSSNVAALRQYVQKNYDATRKLLNLENMEKDSFWRDNNMVTPDHVKAPKDIGAVILKLAAELQPPVESLSLAHNKFSTLRQLAHLAHYLPNLINLSLANNQISDLREIPFLARDTKDKDKISTLRELIFLDNPFRNYYSAKGKLDDYRADVLKSFPGLTMLDMIPVTKIGFDVSAVPASGSAAPADADTPNAFPVGMQAAVLPEQTQALVGEFFTKFFPAFDTARPSLAEAYHANATFSYSVNTTIPPRARIRRYQVTMPHQKELTWEKWTPMSRNLTRIRTLNQAQKYLSSSAPDIVKAIGELPKTVHDLQNAGSSFLVDAWFVDGVTTPQTSPPAGIALYATVHGQFTELPAQGVRSFDRTFILIPTAEGSPAARAGWPCVILSDQLVVRNFAGSDEWQPGPIQVQVAATEEGPKRHGTPQTATLPPVAAPAVQPQPPVEALLATIPEPQRNLVMQVKLQTGLNTQFAGQCLEANGWDIVKALSNFAELKPSIPPEAYQQ